MRDILICCAALVAHLGESTAASAKDFAPPPSAKVVAAVSSQDLAKSYDGVKRLRAMLPAAEMGITLHTPEGTISKRNAAKVGKILDRRLSVYGEEIKTRGYVDLSGVYFASVSPSCADTQSWLGVVRRDKPQTIEIVQSEFEFALKHRFTFAKSEDDFDIDVEGVVVQKRLALRDPMNSDFVFVGVVMDGMVKIRPDTNAVLSSWPNWVRAPKREDLNACVLTLVR